VVTWKCSSVLCAYEKLWEGKTSSQSVASSCHSFARYGYKRRLEIENTHNNCYGKYYTFLRNVIKKIIEKILFLYSRNNIIIYSSLYVLKREVKWNISILQVELKKRIGFQVDGIFVYDSTKQTFKDIWK
jgi:hypothetical protein